MELKYKNWNDISINVYNKLQTLLTPNNNEDVLLGTLDNNIQLLSILCDVDEDKICELSRSEFSALLSQTKFLSEIPKAKIRDNYVVNGKKYNVFLNISDMQMSQYIDYQTFIKDKDKYTAEIMACFLIPKGKKYGEGYDIAEVIKEFGEHLSIVDAYSIMFFFAISFQSLTKTTLIYLEKKLKREMKKMTSEQKAKITEAMEQLREVIDLLKNGDGFTI